MPDNVCIPFYEPGGRITGFATAAVTGKRFVGVSAGLSTDGNISVAHAAAAGVSIGVAAYDAPANARVPVLNGPGFVVPVEAGGAITAGDRVQVGANGTAVTLAAGIPVGVAVNGAASGEDARIRLLT